MTQINKSISIDKIDRISSPLWSDPRNVNTLSHGFLCSGADPAPQGKSNPCILTWRKAVKPKSFTIKKVLHKLQKCFSTFSRMITHFEEVYFNEQA